jgi:hypothetical protein
MGVAGLSSGRLGVWVAAVIIVCRCCWCRIRAGRVAAIGVAVADGARHHAAGDSTASAPQIHCIKHIKVMAPVHNASDSFQRL